MKKQQKILMYHSVGTLQNREVGAGLYAVPVESFEEQMEYVAKVENSSKDSSLAYELIGDRL